MHSPFPRLLRGTLFLIAIVQFALGIAFVLAPEASAQALGLPPATGWANWLFGQFGARALGFGVGMLVAARHIEQARPWIAGMILVQVIDWLVTLKYLYLGDIALNQVSTAPYFPLLFIALLWVAMPRRASDDHPAHTTSHPSGA